VHKVKEVVKIVKQ